MGRFLSAITILVSIFMLCPAHASDDYETFGNGNSNEKWRNCYKGARTPAVVKDYKDVAIATFHEKTLPVDYVKKAIVEAARKNKWNIGNVAGGKIGGKLEASLLVRGKHTVIVEIPYTAEKYSLLYKESTNMNYASCESERYIHPNYNVWVGRLQQAIVTELEAIE